MAEPRPTAAPLDASAVQEPIEDRVSQPNGAIISGRYRIEGVLGSGGMGTVYLAQHTHMRKRVALKMLHAETSQVPELVARFEREAVAMSRGEHPNIATATDFGRAENGAFFLVLEYIEGYSLREALKTGPMEVRRVAHIARQIISALERSHELGIIHRDLKPENIMLVPRQGDVDYVKILDFGLAKLAPETLEVEGESPGQAITRHGSVFGTPRYMAPEQCVGEDVDGRADLYALGLILYEALTGLHPFNEREPRKMIRHHLFTPIPPMKTRAPAVTVPPSIDALVMRLLEKPRGKRYASATELLAALAEACEREAILPVEPSTRLVAPRNALPPPSAGGRPAAPPTRELQSDALATQDVSVAGATQDLSVVGATQDLSVASATQDLSIAGATQDLSVAGATQDLVDSVAAQDFADSAATQDLPSTDSSQPPPVTAETQPPSRAVDATQPPAPQLDTTQPLPAATTQPSFTVAVTQPPFTAAVTQPPSPKATPRSALPQAEVRVHNVPTQPPRAAWAEGAGGPGERDSAAVARAAPLRKRPVVLLIPLTLLALILGLFARRPSPVPAPLARPAVSPPPATGERAPAPPPSALAPAAELTRASATGIPALLLLEKSFPRDVRLPRALAQAYIAQGSGLEALRWQAKAVALQESSVYDGEIMQAAALAMSAADSADPAIELLEREFGTRGVDVLIALVNKPGPSRVKSSISKGLTQAEVRAHASPAALIAFDLRTAAKCETKRALLSRAAQDGDQRTLQQLKALTSTRGCGTLSLHDCWPCLRKDAALRSAIAAITARTSLAH